MMGEVRQPVRPVWATSMRTGVLFSQVTSTPWFLTNMAFHLEEEKRRVFPNGICWTEGLTKEGFDLFKYRLPKTCLPVRHDYKLPQIPVYYGVHAEKLK